MKKVFAILVCILAVACSSGTGTSEPTIGHAPEGAGYTGGPIQAGTVDFVVSSGNNLTTLDYVISNPSHSYTGTWFIGAATQISDTVGGIAVGAGYTVSLSGQDSAGFACTGSTSGITVNDNAVTSCNIPVVCATDAGSTNPFSGSISASVSVTLDGGQCSTVAGWDAPTDFASGGHGDIICLVDGTTVPTLTYSAGTGSLSGLPTLNPWDAAAGPEQWDVNFTCQSFHGAATVTCNLSQGPSDPCNSASGQTQTLTIQCE